jgi:hypothetical protein
MDTHGRVFFNRTLLADEEMARLSLDLSRLTDNNYVLKVSNGLEMITRTVKISTVKPILQTRSVTLQ